MKKYILFENSSYSSGNTYLGRLNMLPNFFSVKIFAIVLLVIIVVLTGVALGVGFGLRQTNDDEDEFFENCEF